MKHGLNLHLTPKQDPNIAKQFEFCLSIAQNNVLFTYPHVLYIREAGTKALSQFLSVRLLW